MKQSVLIVSIIAVCIMVNVYIYTEPSDLYDLTDEYVESLEDITESYPTLFRFNDDRQRKLTPKKDYQVGVIGRQVIVKIMEKMDDDERLKANDKLIKKLKEDIKETKLLTMFLQIKEGQ